jgi:hypothetical protein
LSIHLYKDAELLQRVSEGDMTAPDTDVFDGTAGEEKDRQLYLANEQTTLAAQIGAADTVLSLSDARFTDGDSIIIGTEMMVVASGGGTIAITVNRAQEGTSAVSHDTGARVYSACNYTDLSLQPVDVQGTDESSWCAVASTQEELDACTPGEALILGSKTYDQVLSFWRRITVPPGTPMQNKSDLKFHITGTESLV